MWKSLFNVFFFVVADVTNSSGLALLSWLQSSLESISTTQKMHASFSFKTKSCGFCQGKNMGVSIVLFGLSRVFTHFCKIIFIPIQFDYYIFFRWVGFNHHRPVFTYQRCRVHRRRSRSRRLEVKVAGCQGAVGDEWGFQRKNYPLWVEGCSSLWSIYIYIYSGLVWWWLYIDIYFFCTCRYMNLCVYIYTCMWCSTRYHIMFRCLACFFLHFGVTSLHQDLVWCPSTERQYQDRVWQSKNVCFPLHRIVESWFNQKMMVEQTHFSCPPYCKIMFFSLFLQEKHYTETWTAANC